MSDPRLFVGFDLGGTKMLAHVYEVEASDSAGEPAKAKAYEKIGRERKKTHGYRGPEAGVERIVEVITSALEDAGREAKDLTAIGIGCPGPVDMERGVLVGPPNLGWGETDIAGPLTKAFGCPAFVVNDVDAGMYGEYRFGAAAGSRCAVGIFPGTGVGGGCVHEGRIFRGAAASCMEIGHVCVDPGGPLCGCGQRGCLEAVASRLSIAAQAAKAAYRGEAPHLFEDAGTDLREIRSGAIANGVEKDPVIRDIVAEAGRQIGLATASLVHLLGPDVIVLGGGLAEAIPKLLVKTVEDAAKDRVMPAYRKSFKVVTAELADDAGVLGAAAWADREVGA